MSKKILALTLACLLAFACGCNTAPAEPAPTAAAEPVPTAEPAPAANPNTVVASYAELMAAQPAIKLNDAPAGSQNVIYSVVNNIPAIAQIDFVYNGCSYTYRAAVCPAGAVSSDISGDMTQYPTISAGELASENRAGGSYTLRMDGTTGAGVINWTNSFSGCQYSLATANGCLGSPMPVIGVLTALYTCTTDAKMASGSVLSVTDSTIAMTLDNGNSAVLERSQVKSLTVAANDTVSITYVGDLGGTAYLLSAVKTGTVEQNTFSGTIFLMNGSTLYVSTADNNVFVFETNAATRVTGLASVLAEDQSVTITYSGDLYGNALAEVIEVTGAAPIPTPTPVPTAAPQPTAVPGYDRVTSGTVTSVAGSYVTVQGICFLIYAPGTYVSGTPEVGGTAEIYFRDYGSGNYAVTSAYFYPAAPKTYSTSGIVGEVNWADANSIYFLVSGSYFHLNTRGCGGSGSPSNGCWAYIEYTVSNGVNEVTYGEFSEPQPQPTPTQYYYTEGVMTGTGAINENYMYIIVNGIQFKLANGNYSGTLAPDVWACVNYVIDNGEYVATSVSFSFREDTNYLDSMDLSPETIPVG